MFAKALLIATHEKQLVDPRKRKPNGANAVTLEQIARMERELVSLQSQVKSIEDSYGIDNLHLTVAKGYVAKLLAIPHTAIVPTRVMVIPSLIWCVVT